MTIHRPTRPALLALLIGVAAVALPALVAAQGNNNLSPIPTLDGFGLATLAGALALAGSWVVARRRTKK